MKQLRIINKRMTKRTNIWLKTNENGACVLHFHMSEERSQLSFKLSYRNY